jgi:hypothetical protein
MFKINTIKFLDKNNYEPENKEAASQLYDMLLSKITETTINDYALYVMTHIKDRKRMYLQEKDQFKTQVRNIAK